jgi:iron complex outermembrane receptor protein
VVIQQEQSLSAGEGAGRRIGPARQRQPGSAAVLENAIETAVFSRIPEQNQVLQATPCGNGLVTANVFCKSTQKLSERFSGGHHSPSTLVALLLAAAGAANIALADTPAAGIEVVPVTATRVGTNAFDVPAAISSVPGEQLLQDARGVNLSDDIGTVPGLLARNRNNYAQDQQISIRGFGASSTFGVRGIRIYQDGIPASGPDGQGQVSQLNLDSAERVEVLRGPFSALYGNSSGGVIQIFTARGEGPPQLRSALVYGSYGNLRASLDARGATGDFGYNIDFTHFQVDGYRPHSSAQNESFNGRFDYRINDSSRLKVIANIISRPGAQDPLGLSPAEFAADPYSTDPAAALYNTRKSLEQQLGGLTHELALSDTQTVQVMAYGGHRSVQQFLAIPAMVQAPPTSSGGVVSLDRDFGGADARWSWETEIAGRKLTWVVGTNYDYQNELRRGYNNYIGTLAAPEYGLQGALRRDENDISSDLDEYTQATWEFAPLWSLMAGLRHSDVRFDSQNHLSDLVGSATYTATTPVGGLLYKAKQWLHVYASYGQGFQTPIAAELAYRPDGEAGLNLGLRPARNNSWELGTKMQVSSGLSSEVALFHALTRDEIVVDTNSGGRTTYQNAPYARRQGLELSANYHFVPSWHVQLAYTYLQATYPDAFHTCAAAPCPTPIVPVAAGNRLPGVPKSDLYATLHWGQESGWHAGAIGQYVTTVAANERNTVFAPAYPVFSVLGGYRAQLRSVRLESFLRINNVLDRHYVGSVIVDDVNQRYFEPGPGFSLLAGVSARLP